MILLDNSAMCTTTHKLCDFFIPLRGSDFKAGIGFVDRMYAKTTTHPNYFIRKPDLLWKPIHSSE